MPAEQSFLVRGPDGRVSTVTARSVRGALETTLNRDRKKLKVGDFLSIKPRGSGEWEDFKVTK